MFIHIIQNRVKKVIVVHAHLHNLIDNMEKKVSDAYVHNEFT